MDFVRRMFKKNQNFDWGSQFFPLFPFLVFSAVPLKIVQEAAGLEQIDNVGKGASRKLTMWGCLAKFLRRILSVWSEYLDGGTK